MFTCRVCKSSEFKFEQMKKERRLVETQRGICKSCAAEYEKYKIHVRRAEKNPKNYLMCDDCDRIFSKYNTGPKFKFDDVNHPLRVDCPFCKSENIQNY